LAGQKLAGIRWARTYHEAAEGELIALISSDGFLEIACVNGNASRHLGISAGDMIEAAFV
jgi:S-adenosylmethionine hydrolase